MISLLFAFLSFIFFMLYAFVYENEHKQISNRLEDWWIQLDDRRGGFMAKEAQFIHNLFNRIFGEKTFSVRSISISLIFSLLVSTVVGYPGKVYIQNFMYEHNIGDVTAPYPWPGGFEGVKLYLNKIWLSFDFSSDFVYVTSLLAMVFIVDFCSITFTRILLRKMITARMRNICLLILADLMIAISLVMLAPCFAALVAGLGFGYNPVGLTGDPRIASTITLLRVAIDYPLAPLAHVPFNISAWSFNITALFPTSLHLFLALVFFLSNLMWPVIKPLLQRPLYFLIKHDKGPVLGLSVLFGAIAAIMAKF